MEEMKSITLNGKKYDSFPDQTARESLNKKIPGPEGGAAVGQYLRVAAVDDTGNITAIETVNAPGQNSGGDVSQSGLSSTAVNLLLTVLRNGAYASDQTSTIDALEAVLKSGTTNEEDVTGVTQTGTILAIVSGVTATQTSSRLAIA